VVSNTQTQKAKQMKPKGKNQANYIRSISENIVTICIGPAGSGKTSVAAGMAAEYLLEGKVRKIIITRPTIEAGKGIGFLPGSAMEKVNPYMVPILEELQKHMGPDYQEMMEKKLIDVIPLDYCRGRNWHDCFVIVDESSNATFSQLKMVISRIGHNAKIVIEGDPDQTDLRPQESGALEFMAEYLNGYDYVGVVRLTAADIVRNKIIGPIMARMTNESFQAFQSERGSSN
jgi:phosphate starvation-inducible PhoH-like protein